MSKICLYCNKEIEEESIHKYFCSNKCSDKYSIRDKMETIIDDGVICPYCEKEQQDISDGSLYYEANGDEIECQYCEKKFILVADQHTTFTATPTDEELENNYI